MDCNIQKELGQEGDMEEMQEKSNTLQIRQSRIDIQTYH